MIGRKWPNYAYYYLRQGLMYLHRHQNHSVAEGGLETSWPSDLFLHLSNAKFKGVPHLHHFKNDPIIPVTREDKVFLACCNF